LLSYSRSPKPEQLFGGWKVANQEEYNDFEQQHMNFCAAKSTLSFNTGLDMPVG
jgi:hypothetical protein